MSDFYQDENLQHAFAEGMAASYTAAAERREERVGVMLAGIPIELRFASPALSAILLPALRHLPPIPEGQTPGLTISAWDRAGSGIAAPPPPFDKKRITDRGDIWGFASRRYRLAFHYSEFSVSLFDREHGNGYFWIDDAAGLPYWSAAAPLRTLLHWCMEASGHQLLHAAAVGTVHGGLLLTGRGGLGKSSTALTGLLNGMDFAGDDYVAVVLEPKPRVYPLYSSAKVNRDQIGRFAALAAHLRNPGGGDDEKAIFDLLPAYRAQIPDEGMPIRAILVPGVADQEESVIDAEIGLDAVRHAAAFSTVEQLPYAGKGTYDFINALTQRVPAFRLRLGRDQAALAASLKHLLAHPLPAGARAHAPSADWPLVSVVVPVYNRERMLPEVLANIRSQGYPQLEIIVVDDGSTDRTADVARTQPDVRLFEQPNGGPAQARNRAIINARGEFVACLDSDDLWPEGMLVHLVDALRRDPQADVAYGWAQMARVGANGDTEFESNPLEGFPFYLSGTVFRRRAFDQVGLLDPELRFGEDVDWFNRARERGTKVLRLDCASVIVRRHGGNMTYGKNLVQLNVLRVAKKVLDRRRAAALPSSSQP
ncbi:glycosyltransferase family 2 protein [Ottowia sp. VDI28]|uniref:glycosyltransferase family 2 protein n=1 Tax=Ottowia sp. VDI28 TaxID=3133968 RepID=UPI003C2B664A